MCAQNSILVRWLQRESPMMTAKISSLLPFPPFPFLPSVERGGGGGGGKGAFKEAFVQIAPGAAPSLSPPLFPSPQMDTQPTHTGEREGRKGVLRSVSQGEKEEDPRGNHPRLNLTAAAAAAAAVPSIHPSIRAKKERRGGGGDMNRTWRPFSRSLLRPFAISSSCHLSCT